ncbi:Fibronectin type III domain-containing protein 3B [Bagarius yarrelli]|uniref:Fibronectin type III domain-containing protein 3B n=1 Tax=Bagarius yarrelli TaxID=175774 RepID=A0A556VXJ2_BAGYA|nr:Fibronectin type III domain-containing protein 3B [Bagarius yarrelli]
MAGPPVSRDDVAAPPGFFFSQRNDSVTSLSRKAHLELKKQTAAKNTRSASACPRSSHLDPVCVVFICERGTGPGRAMENSRDALFGFSPFAIEKLNTMRPCVCVTLSHCISYGSAESPHWGKTERQDVPPHQYYQHRLPPIYPEDSEMEVRREQDVPSGLDKPQSDGSSVSCSYELLLADKGCDSKYRVVYSGEELQYTLTDLRPATDYHPPVDNGSKISSYVLEWDEGKRNSVFRECYFGHQRHFKVVRLCPAVGYTFRVAALNDIGSRVGAVTSHGFCMSWEPPEDKGGSRDLSYILEISEEKSGAVSEWVVVYRGSKREHVCEDLNAATQYSVRLSSESAGGRSQIAALKDDAEVTEVYKGSHTECIVGNLLPGATYRFRVRAANESGTDESSGVDISGYRLYWGHDEDSLELVYCGTDSSCEISELEAAATNLAGAGPYSELAWCRTSAAAPSVVSGLYVQDGFPIALDSEPFCLSTCLSLVWDEPNCNGEEIAATPSLWRRSLSPLLVRTRPLPPNPPRLECGSAGPQSLKLRWGDSSKSPNTDTDITYILQIEDRNQRFVPIYRGPSHTFKVQRLNELSSYSFRIQALSEAGEGPVSEIYTFTTTKCVYKGEDTVFQLFGLQWNTDYRLRVFVCRRCADTAQELCGSFSPSTYFSPRRVVSSLSMDTSACTSTSAKKLTDEQYACIIVVGVASFSVLMAYLLQLLI